MLSKDTTASWIPAILFDPGLLDNRQEKILGRWIHLSTSIDAGRQFNSTSYLRSLSPSTYSGCRTRHVYRATLPQPKWHFYFQSHFYQSLQSQYVDYPDLITSFAVGIQDDSCSRASFLKCSEYWLEARFPPSFSRFGWFCGQPYWPSFKTGCRKANRRCCSCPVVHINGRCRAIWCLCKDGDEWNTNR